MSVNNKTINVAGINQLLHLIEGVNQDIEISRKMNSVLMVRQYQHLKGQYTKQLLDLLKDYRLPLQVVEMV